MITESMIRGIGMTSQRTRERLITRLSDKGITNKQVLSVMLNTPRHLFVDEALASRAYEDDALPIGQGQTISQPYIVARMTELLLAGGIPGKVLEIGTGCGYQTAVLSQLVPEVYSVERIEVLLHQARKRLRSLKIKNVRFKHSDGSWGWDNNAPYDGIIVTAAPSTIPEALLKQLAVGGKLVIPVGRQDRAQELTVIHRTNTGYEQEVIEAVTFVPLINGDL
ncbi:MAG: protein-L-isoaspartate(D-aspartate) O-methyltransferase [Gammaproteobacteria bacterium]|nr:protein-L-isoaspartate(D-aspartate) O-methyltransferase [Gammaproteobacteria bacterium]